MTRHEPDLIAAADDEKNGIVGATICFTPQPSPRGSPRSTPAPLMNSVETEEYIGSVDGLTSDGKEKSSFDDDANEFEMLDMDVSKASIEVEDLDVDDEDVDDILKSTAATMKKIGDVDDHALKELFRSPPSSLPSLNDDAVAGDEGEAKKLPVTASLMNEDSLQYSDGTPFSRMTKSMLSHMAKLGQQDAASVEGDVSNDASSLKIDDTPISTIKILQTFWENRVLGKTTADTVQASEAANSVDETDRQSSSRHVTSSEGFSPKPKSQLLCSAMPMIWVWIQTLILVCAFSTKKSIEKLCHALARNIISSAAGSVATDVETTIESKPSDEIDLEEIVESSRLNLGTMFSDSDQADRGEAEKSVDNSLISEVTPKAAFWKSPACQVIVFVSFFLRLLVWIFGASEALRSEEFHDNVCLTTNGTTFESIPLWEIDLSQIDATHIELHASSSLSNVLPVVSIAVALLVAYFHKPDVIRKLSSMKREANHLTGIWTAKEHEQFIKGFDRHGANWRLVASYIPTRTYEQVKAHGMHWKKIGSPENMKRSKKVVVEASPKPIQLASAAFAQLTPKVANLSPFVEKKVQTKSREEQLASAREYAQKLKQTQSAVKVPKSKVKRSSRHSL